MHQENTPSVAADLTMLQIILTSTVIALAFGSIYNVLVRRFVAADEVPKNVGLKSKIQAALGKLRSKIASLSRKTKAE
jgi:phosphatidylinositol glycan class T